MFSFSLQSGSNGNSICVEAGDVTLLFDAGISGRLAASRMAEHGRDIRDCDAVIISHDHSDHTRCAGVFQRKFGLPIYITDRAYRAIGSYIAPVSDVRTFVAGEPLVIGDVTVHTIRTPHDGFDGVCFVVAHDGKKLGILTDLGHPFPALRDAMTEVDAAYLECNYDPEMLRRGPYPEALKRRIAGAGGHLSNDEAAELAGHGAAGGMKWLAAAHLSEHNNQPRIALATLRSRVGKTLTLHLAPRDRVGDLLEV